MFKNVFIKVSISTGGKSKNQGAASNSTKKSANSKNGTSLMKCKLLAQIEKLTLPLNTLDQLIDELGGPKRVAEITGRKKRCVQSNGKVNIE